MSRAAPQTQVPFGLDPASNRRTIVSLLVHSCPLMSKDLEACVKTRVLNPDLYTRTRFDTRARLTTPVHSWHLLPIGMDYPETPSAQAQRSDGPAASRGCEDAARTAARPQTRGK